VAAGDPAQVTAALLRLAVALLARLGLLWHAAAPEPPALPVRAPLLAPASPLAPRVSLGLQGSYAKPQTGSWP
jgi:hypothetical protein